MTQVLASFVGGIADARRLPVTLMAATGAPPEQVVVSFMKAAHDGYQFDPALGAYVLVRR